MNRADAIAALGDPYDILIIGGGATGLGCAVDAATRGYRTLLVTAGDFSQATSSRSTKLIHDGVRYLERGDLTLVRESLRERRLLLRNAPNLVRELRFLIPCYHLRQIAYYGAGLKAYDLLAGRSNLRRSGVVTRDRAGDMAPTLRGPGLKAGIVYSDGQFNDSRLAIALARTAHAHGGVVANYARVTAMTRQNGRLTGAIVADQVSGREYTVRAKTVVNAAGIFADDLRRMDDPEAEPVLSHSRGTHIVLDHSFLPGDTAILIPRTEDRRVVFIIPWEGRTLVGTTDVPVTAVEMEPMVPEDDIDYLLRYASRYLSRVPQRRDVLGAFCGLRPLVKGSAASTAALSRDHVLLVSESGLITVTGGKWTTYRRMAEDAIDRAARSSGLPQRLCVTGTLTLFGAESTDPRWRELGASTGEIEEYDRRYTGSLHPDLPYTHAMAAYVVDHEMSVNLDDVLSRRLRALYLNSAASIEIAPMVARLMADRQGHSEGWVEKQVAGYGGLARRYGLRTGTA